MIIKTYDDVLVLKHGNISFPFDKQTLINWVMDGCKEDLIIDDRTVKREEEQEDKVLGIKGVYKELNAYADDCASGA